jgi:hypothetical protein
MQKWRKCLHHYSSTLFSVAGVAAEAEITQTEYSVGRMQFRPNGGRFGAVLLTMPNVVRVIDITAENSTTLKSIGKKKTISVNV